jgi:NAD(P)-dependent dehydrogenase (short-subunit alcohol dehydrogenase family)
MGLTNASAIVTGGAGGFGSATVRGLAQMGARVVIADVSDERGEALAGRSAPAPLYVPPWRHIHTSPRRSRPPPKERLPLLRGEAPADLKAP